LWVALQINRPEAAMKTPHDAEQASAGAQAGKPPYIRGPWPDQRARQEMSHAENACENLGKHGKNPDWERKW
jgi:hypothetical protein